MRKGLLALCLMLAYGTAAAQFDDWDQNDNDEIAQDEFMSGVDDAGLFGEIDQDSDGFVDEGEFESAGIEGNWEDWDGDGDGYVDAGDFYEGAFGTFDEDGDGNWSNDEWDNAGDADWLQF